MSAVDVFLKIDGIEGESNDSKHKNEIELLSFRWGLKQAGTMAIGSGGGAGRAAFTDLTIEKRADKSTPKLVVNCAAGTHLKDAMVVCRKAGGQQQEFLKIKLYDVLISSFDESEDPVGIPKEEVTLNFGKVEVTYCVQKPDGSLEAPIIAGWDLRQNKKI